MRGQVSVSRIGILFTLSLALTNRVASAQEIDVMTPYWETEQCLYWGGTFDPPLGAAHLVKGYFVTSANPYSPVEVSTVWQWGGGGHGSTAYILPVQPIEWVEVWTTLFWYDHRGDLRSLDSWHWRLPYPSEE